MQDEYIDADGNLWTCLENGITWSCPRYGPSDTVITLENDRWYEQGKGFSKWPVLADTSDLMAPWTALKGT